MFSIFQHQPANLKSGWYYTNNTFRFTFGLYHSVNRGILVYAVTSQLDCCLGSRGGLEVAGLAASIGLATLPTITHHPLIFKVSYSAENIHNGKIFWLSFLPTWVEGERPADGVRLARLGTGQGGEEEAREKAERSKPSSDEPCEGHIGISLGGLIYNIKWKVKIPFSPLSSISMPLRVLFTSSHDFYHDFF